MNKILIDALTEIATLDPDLDSSEGWNEWGEADCFHKAKNIASDALKAYQEQSLTNQSETPPVPLR